MADHFAALNALANDLERDGKPSLAWLVEHGAAWPDPWHASESPELLVWVASPWIEPRVLAEIADAIWSESEADDDAAEDVQEFVNSALAELRAASGAARGESLAAAAVNLVGALANDAVGARRHDVTGRGSQEQRFHRADAWARAELAGMIRDAVDAPSLADLVAWGAGG